jgi:hypothetical protein
LNLPPKKNLKLLSTRRSRAWELVLFAACGGENGSRYFKNRAQAKRSGREQNNCLFCVRNRRPQRCASLPEGQGERREGRPARNFRQEIYLQAIPSEGASEAQRPRASQLLGLREGIEDRSVARVCPKGKASAARGGLREISVRKFTCSRFPPRAQAKREL